ncbi:MAG: molybdopterin-dependent oxidoreductase, partial [Deltaproteobacteria bacterium]|nr:molybdopterin-dependent oxidoreductase [Deltaproteobacteria bacterium]
RIASQLKLDLLAFRLKNALRENDIGFRGQPVDNGVSVVECLEAIEPSFRSDPPVRRPADNLRRGRGLALGVMPIGLTAGTPPVTVNAYLGVDGLLTLAVNTSDLGQGARTVFTQLAAEILGISESNVSATLADSSLYPDCAGSGASQVTYFTGNAIVRALEKMKQSALEVAAELWGADPAELTFQDGRVHAADSSQSLSLSEIAVEAARQGRGMTTSGVYQAQTWLPDEETGLGRPYDEYGYAASWAEVEVDIETGQVTVKRLVSAVDAGRAINPRAVEGQIEGGAAMNMGYALTEDLYPPFQGGQHAASGLHEYLIPTAMDVPPVQSIIVEKASRNGPLGAKGLGEITATMIAPAIANAVAAATGVFPDRLPITSERLLALLKDRAQGGEE